jgi:S1-C subfamily serine protease
MRKESALALLLLAGPLYAAPEDSAVQVYFMKFQKDPDSGRAGVVGGWGSGTVIKSDRGRSWVLTNRHVAPGKGGTPFVLHRDHSYPAVWIAADDRYDLALVRIDATLPVVDLADDEPEPGTVLRQWGFPKGGPVQPKTGKALGWIGYKNDMGERMFSAEMSVQPGDSGCLLINPHGKGVAVCCAGQGSSPEHELCVPLKPVRAFLAKHLND